ncbi:MAG: molybdopterin-dependent oxidoreductase [Verrucomicrobiota bacterium]
MKTYLGVFFGVLFSVTSLAAEVIVKIGEASPVTLTLQDLELLPHQTVTAKDHGGEEASWTGVPLYQVLQKAGLSLGDSLRGPVLAQYVLVTAADGYRAVFALPELDPRCTDDPVLLVDAMNDAPLPAAQGPCRLVLPKERRHFRWVRQVVKIEVLKAPTASR